MDTSPDGITGKDTNGLPHTGTGNNAAITTHTQCRIYVSGRLTSCHEYTLLYKSGHNLDSVIAPLHYIVIIYGYSGTQLNWKCRFEKQQARYSH